MEYKNKRKREKPSNQDVELLKQLFQKVTLTPSGMLRMMAYLVENPDMVKMREREIKATEKSSEAILTLAATQADMNKLLLRQLEQLNNSIVKLSAN